MCGIVGVMREHGAPMNDTGLLVRMRERLAHRGPDDARIHLSGPAGFGFRRLSVIDRPGGRQPMVDAETGTALVFNGEIYNFRELRSELSRLGHRFLTESDTEVLLRSWVQWRHEAPRRLTGMFAFAVWEPGHSELTMVRDRLGIKPLFWTRCGGDLLFASEPKAFFEHPAFVAEPDLEGLSSYLTFRQAVWHHGYLRGVHKVLPGHMLSFARGRTNERVYWNLPVPRADVSVPASVWLERAEELLTRALKRCLIADIPLGLFLSGGLDSSLLASLMRREHTEPVRSFSIGYGDEAYDEGPFAEAVAQHFGLQHTHLVLEREQFESGWELLLTHRDGPLSIPHELAFFHLCREVKRQVSVAIAGDGADELFGGYGRVMRSPMDWRKVRLAHRMLGGRAAAAIGRALGGPLTQLACAEHVDHVHAVYHWMPFEEKWSLLSEDALRAVDHDRRLRSLFRDAFAAASAADPYDRVLHVFQKFHLGCLLDKLDSVGMAASIEGRVPFVDHELVECFVHMPHELKLEWKSPWSRLRAIGCSAASASERLDTTKVLLRRLGARWLQAATTVRKKLGFPTPLDDWLAHGGQNRARELLLEPRTLQRGLFRADALRALLARPQPLNYDFYGKKVWMLMNIELWLRTLDEHRSARARIGSGERIDSAGVVALTTR